MGAMQECELFCWRTSPTAFTSILVRLKTLVGNIIAAFQFALAANFVFFTL